MDKTLVICRFHEDISWLSDVKGYNIIIYDKGDPTALHHLPNIGREAHTYIHHIIQNYDNLSTLNVFNQAWPFQHACADLYVDKLNKLSEKNKFVGLSDTIIEVESNDSYEWDGVLENLTVEQYFKRLFPRYNCPKSFTTRGNGLFAVHRDRIRYHDVNFYKNIMKDFESQWTLPYLLERLWHFIFAGPLLDTMCHN